MLRLEIFGIIWLWNEGGLKVHKLTMMQWSNLTKCGLFFNIVSLVIHTLLPSVLQHLGFPWYRSSHPDPQKCHQLQMWPDLICIHYVTSSSVRYCFPAKKIHVGEQKIVRWCQIRRIWREINQFKATVRHSSHWLIRILYEKLCVKCVKWFFFFFFRFQNSDFQSQAIKN